MENTNEKTAGQKLQEELTWKFPSVALEAPERVKEAYDFCEPYKTFLSEAKTERECVLKAEAMLKDAGYTEFDPKASYQPGDKVYFNNRGKAIIASTFGTAPLDEGIRLNAAHIDAPRLDLKPTPEQSPFSSLPYSCDLLLLYKQTPHNVYILDYTCWLKKDIQSDTDRLSHFLSVLPKCKNESGTVPEITYRHFSLPQYLLP